MYDELIKQLRDAAKMSEGNAMAKLYNEAADAIEKLSKELTELKLLTCCCTEPPKDMHNCFETIDTPIHDYEEKTK